MTDWTQRIEELADAYCTEADRIGPGGNPKPLVDDFKPAIKALMNEYAIERLEELKKEQYGDNPVWIPQTDIEAMQRSLKERLAKGGVE